MNCGYCNSEVLFLKEQDNKIGLYCKSCGRWQKWVDQSEKTAVLKQIEKQKNERIVDARDVEKVLTTYKGYKEKFKTLNEDIYYYNKYNAKVTTEAEKSAMYNKVLKLKELTAKIAAYEEIIMTLQLNKV